MAISIGDAILFLSADDKNLKKGLKGAESATRTSASRMSKHAEMAGAKVSSALTGMAGRMAAGMTAYLGVSALTNYTNQWIQLGDQIEEQSQRTGLSVDMISRLNYVAGKAGLNLSALEVTTRQMSKAIANAGMNTKILGINVRDLVAMSPDQQFMSMLGAISQVESATLRAALAMKYFGRSGTEILPLITNGISGLTDEMAKADKKGVVFTAEEAANAAAYADAIQDFTNSWIQLGGAIAQSPIGTLVFKEMEGLTAAFNSTGIDDFTATINELLSNVERALGLKNKKEEAREIAGEKAYQDAKARNEAAKAGKFNPASSDRDRELMRQAMIFANGETGVSAETRGTGMYPNEPAGAPGFYDRSDHYTDVRRGYLRGAKSTISGRQRAGDYYGSTIAQRYGISEQELAARNTQYNTIVISHANFSAGDDMVKAYNKRMSQRPF